METLPVVPKQGYGQSRKKKHMHLMPRDGKEAVPPCSLEETRAKTTQTERKHANQRKLSDRRRFQVGGLVWWSAGRRGGKLERLGVGGDAQGPGVLLLCGLWGLVVVVGGPPR